MKQLFAKLGLLEDNGVAGVLAGDAAVQGPGGDAEKRHVREIRSPAADYFMVDGGH